MSSHAFHDLVSEQVPEIGLSPVLRAHWRGSMQDGTKISGVAIWCTACREEHVVPTSAQGYWNWDGNAEFPTITPSIAVSGHLLERNDQDEWTGWARDAQGKIIPTVCHSIITAGQIQYCSDSTHALAGQTMPLSPFKWPIKGGREQKDVP